MLLRFTGVSLISAVLDNLVFAVFCVLAERGRAQVIGRVLATLFNYWGNKNTVFRSQEQSLGRCPSTCSSWRFPAG